MVDYFMAYNLIKFDGWALIGAWAAIGMNTVFEFSNACLLNDKFVIPGLFSCNTKNINDSALYHIRPQALCDTNPNH